MKMLYQIFALLSIIALFFFGGVSILDRTTQFIPEVIICILVIIICMKGVDLK